MQAARRFAGCEEAFNGLAFRVDHLGLCVELQAAHGVVNGRRDFNRIELRAFDLEGGLRTIEVGILPGIHVAVVDADRFDERLRIDAGVLRELFERIAFLHKSELEAGLELRDAAHRAVVKNFKGGAARLRRDGRARDVARGHLGNEALAFAVDENRALPAHRLRNNDGRPDKERRIELNFLHVDERRADLFAEVHAVARRARLVRSLRGRIQIRQILLDERLVGAEAARGEHDRLGLDLVDAVVLAFHEHAGHCARLVRHEAHQAAVEAQVNAFHLFGLIAEERRQIGPDRLAALRTVHAGR